MATAPPNIIRVDPGTPCPSGYAAQLDPTVCAITSAFFRAAVGIPQTATTEQSAAIIRAVQPVAQPNLDLRTQPSSTTQSPKSGPVPSTLPGTTMTNPALVSTLVQAQDPSMGLIGAIIGGVSGFVTGGPAGAVAGAIAGSGGLPGGGGTALPGSSFTGTTCPPGYYSVGGTCVSPGAALPGGAPFTLPASGTQVSSGGNTVSGTGGIGAVSPEVYSTIRRRCPPGYRLADDNLCYRGLSNSQRKWPYHKPYISRGDYKAITRADRARKKLVNLTKRAGAWASMHKPSPRGGSRGVITKAEAARALRK